VLGLCGHLTRSSSQTALTRVECQSSLCGGRLGEKSVARKSFDNLALFYALLSRL
jgi:hypothetical protein